MAKNFSAGGIVEFQRMLNQRCQQSKKQLIQLLPETWQCWKVPLSAPVSLTLVVGAGDSWYILLGCCTFLSPGLARDLHILEPGTRWTSILNFSHLQCGVAFPSKQQGRQALVRCLSIIWRLPRHCTFSARGTQPWAQMAFRMGKCPDNGPSETVQDGSQDHLWIPSPKCVQALKLNQIVSIHVLINSLLKQLSVICNN